MKCNSFSGILYFSRKTFPRKNLGLKFPKIPKHIHEKKKFGLKFPKIPKPFHEKKVGVKIPDNSETFPRKKEEFQFFSAHFVCFGNFDFFLANFSTPKKVSGFFCGNL